MPQTLMQEPTPVGDGRGTRPSKHRPRGGLLQGNNGASHVDLKVPTYWTIFRMARTLACVIRSPICGPLSPA